MSEGALRRIALATICLSALLFLVAAPLVGWPRVVRLPAVLVPAIALILLVARPWQWPGASERAATWQPGTRLIWVGALTTFLLLFWYVLTRFHSGQINAIDFTVYFDRPCFQTTQGRPLFVENSDTPGFSNRSELADHAYWLLLPVCSLYAVHPSPLWLHALSALAIVGGAVFVQRIMRRLEIGGVLSVATALAFVLNDNTARALNYGFHPEVFYAFLVPWMVDAGLRGSRKAFLLAALSCVLVKEDALFPIFAVSVALGLHRFRVMSWADRGLFLVLPVVVAVANLLAFYYIVAPMLTGKSGPTYAHFWGNYGDTPALAIVGMMSQPRLVLTGLLTSGIWTVLKPHLYLPLIGWRWSLGILPILVLYGASANQQVRAFGIYYAIVLVPFLVIASSFGALSLARRFLRQEGRAQLTAACLVVAGAVVMGAGHRGYSLRPWRAEIKAVPEALARLSGEPIVLMQSALFPHAGYDERVKLLTRESLDDPRNRGAALLLAPRLGAYPFEREEALRLSGLAPIGPMPGGAVAVRIP